MMKRKSSKESTFRGVIKMVIKRIKMTRRKMKRKIMTLAKRRSLSRKDKNDKSRTILIVYLTKFRTLSLLFHLFLNL